MDYNFRIFDFNIFNEKKSNGSSYDEDGNIIESDEEEVKSYKDNAKFMIQMFGVDETGKTCSIMVEEFKPFFYVMVNDTWSKKHKDDFLSHIKQKIGKYYEDSITDCIIIKRKKLYGFDGGKEH